MTSTAERSDASDLVLDVSLSCAWCFADEASEAAWAILSRLQSAQAHVPSLWLWETANVLVQAERRGRITAAAMRTCLPQRPCQPRAETSRSRRSCSQLQQRRHDAELQHGDAPSPSTVAGTAAKRERKH